MFMPLLSKSQILKHRPVNLNQDGEAIDQEYFSKGITNFDYVVPLCLNNQTFLLKLDLQLSLLYLASSSDSLDMTSIESDVKYFPQLAPNHGKPESFQFIHFFRNHVQTLWKMPRK